MCYCNWFQSARPRQHKSELPALEQLHAMGYEYKSQEQNNQYLIDEKLMKKEREIQSLREKDVINEEAIASLSDQIVKVMEEIKILKMKPLSYSKSVIIQLLLKNT